MRSANGPPGPPSPWPWNIPSGGGGGGPSCALTVPTHRRTAPLRTQLAQVTRFICYLLFSPEQPRSAHSDDGSPLLRQADGLWLSVLPHKQIHLNPFAGASFIDGQTKRAECAALEPHTHHR